MIVVGSRGPISTLTTADGAFAIIGAGIDITDQRLVESRLAQADRLDSIGRLTSGVAHDFNNTLTTLRLRIDRLSGRELDDDSRADLAAAVATIDHTQRLIADLLSFSSRGVSDPVAVDINGEIQRVTDILDDLFGDAVVIGLDLTPERTTVITDPARFEQALTNLAINARDAMPGGGTLTITTSIDTIDPGAGVDTRVPSRLESGRYLVMSVADTGVGIEPRDLAHVFDPYFTTKLPGRGTGLGLATTYGTIAQCGGAIIAESTPGQGSTFHVWLPLAPSEPAIAGAPSRPATGAGSAVLIVDDDDDLRQVLVEEMTRLGYRTTQAGSAAAALDRIDEHVDVLLCDVQLPDRSGHEVVVRFLRRHPDLVAVYISGASRAQLDELVPPDSTLLSKPFTTGDLVAALTGRRDDA